MDASFLLFRSPCPAFLFISIARLLNSAKKLKSVYNPKEHEDYTFVVPYKAKEESNIRNGKYRDPEPIYDPKYPKKSYSDHSEHIQHNLENYRLNKHRG